MRLIKQKIAGEITLAKNPGAAMKKWREIFGITQTELADYLKITPSTISDYEGNRRKSPGINIIRRFIDAIVDIDKRRGGTVAKRIEGEKPPADIFEAYEFPEPLSSTKFVERIKGKVITNKRRLKETNLLGYSIVDSLKAILELPVDEFSKIYGPTPNRAVIFTRVSVGRSPMVAIRVTKFKPTLVVYQGLDRMDDLVARKISEVEKVPIVLTTMPIEEIKNALKRYTYL
ncbi:MAG: helix-turn-helix domain-containing protein [Candidatus Diapherotrites archaeon]|nr:helix-turn-helix domain-containing protein [Candidatus Diapherotrites archaeon]